MHYYRVLKVGYNASQEEIKTSYHKLALALHPDKHPESSEEYKLKFQELQEAYSVLGDVGARRQYDLTFDTNFSTSSTETPHFQEPFKTKTSKTPYFYPEPFIRSPEPKDPKQARLYRERKQNIDERIELFSNEDDIKNILRL
jgi:DnaJ-class molecular chaperone